METPHWERWYVGTLVGILYWLYRCPQLQAEPRCQPTARRTSKWEGRVGWLRCINEYLAIDSSRNVSDLVVAHNCYMARMLPGEAELVSEWTGMPGRANNVQRFEQSDGLDTALYKNYLFMMTLSTSDTGRPIFVPVHFSLGGLGVCDTHFKSQQGQLYLVRQAAGVSVPPVYQPAQEAYRSSRTNYGTTFLHWTGIWYRVSGGLSKYNPPSAGCSSATY